METTVIRRAPKIYAAAFTTVGLMLLGGIVPAAGSMSSSSTSTSNFSPATTACIKQAKRTEKQCRLSGSSPTCKGDYMTALTHCFAAGQGVACATACETAEATCKAGGGLAAEKTCYKACRTALHSALRACAPADTTCIATAHSNSRACKKACKSAPALTQCSTGFSACLAKCPNL